MRESHREQHVRRLDRTGRARRSHRDVDTFEVQRDEKALAENPGKGQVQSVGKAIAKRSVEAQMRNRVEELREKLVGERRDAQHLVMKMRAHGIRRRSESDGAEEIG